MQTVIDFVPVQLVVAALWRAAEVGPDEPINVGSGCGTRLKDLARRMLELSGAPVEIEVAPARSVEVERFTARVERMRTCLRLEPPADALAELPALIRNSPNSRIIQAALGPAA